MADYNYQGFTPDAYDLDQFAGPRPGDKAPDFTVRGVDGASRQLLDFDGDFLVLEMGSVTCPLFQGRRPGMQRLTTRFPKAAFRVLYVREAHPGAAIPAHASDADKATCARVLTEENGETRDVVIDTADGTAHAAYGGYPNSVFILNRAGCVLWVSDWNIPSATHRALAALTRGEPATVKTLFRPVPPWVALRVLRRGGDGSLADFLSGLPRLTWKNLILRNIRVILRRGAGVPPDASC